MGKGMGEGLAATGACSQGGDQGAPGALCTPARPTDTKLPLGRGQGASLTSWQGHAGIATGAGTENPAPVCCTCSRNLRVLGCHQVSPETRGRILPAKLGEGINRCSYSSSTPTQSANGCPSCKRLRAPAPFCCFLRGFMTQVVRADSWYKF